MPSVSYEESLSRMTVNNSYDTNIPSDIHRRLSIDRQLIYTRNMGISTEENIHDIFNRVTRFKGLRLLRGFGSHLQCDSPTDSLPIEKERYFVWELPNGDVIYASQGSSLAGGGDLDPNLQTGAQPEGNSREVVFKNIWLTISSNSEEKIESILREIREVAPQILILPENRIQVAFWNIGEGTGATINRKLDAPTWDEEVKLNYTAPVIKKLDPLFTTFTPGVGGKLILWTGHPGTGKTYAVRALAEHWKKWCSVNYVADPEAFFGHSEYMINAIANPVKKGHRDWALFVLEDCGEFISSSAKDRTGQGLSRLLNAADGFLGQGFNLLFLITANEERTDLHPAITRPGRCVCSIDFELHDREEATNWLKEHKYEGEPLTESYYSVADLYALINPSPLGLEKQKKNVIGFA